MVSISIFQFSLSTVLVTTDRLKKALSQTVMIVRLRFCHMVTKLQLSDPEKVKCGSTFPASQRDVIQQGTALENHCNANVLWLLKEVN